MKLAIVGSTKLNTVQTAAAKEIIEGLIEYRKPEVIISGGALGIDTLAVIIAKEKGLPVIECRPGTNDWPGYKQRNQYIADLCDGLARIIKKGTKTYGSGWTRDRAAEQGKPWGEWIIDEAGVVVALDVGGVKAKNVHPHGL